MENVESREYSLKVRREVLGYTLESYPNLTIEEIAYIYNISYKYLYYEILQENSYNHATKRRYSAEERNNVIVYLDDLRKRIRDWLLRGKNYSERVVYYVFNESQAINTSSYFEIVSEHKSNEENTIQLEKESLQKQYAKMFNEAKADLERKYDADLKREKEKLQKEYDIRLGNEKRFFDDMISVANEAYLYRIDECEEMFNQKLIDIKSSYDKSVSVLEKDYNYKYSLAEQNFRNRLFEKDADCDKKLAVQKGDFEKVETDFSRKLGEYKRLLCIKDLELQEAKEKKEFTPNHLFENKVKQEMKPVLWNLYVENGCHIDDKLVNLVNNSLPIKISRSGLYKIISKMPDYKNRKIGQY